ncbi:MAG: hypothetical protein K2N34_13670, partial [Lachnospiraceae bacterium]|nr:hypothetical protein [Lachnospiraceae bacterium]
MTAEERKADFRQWLISRGKNNGEQLELTTLNTYFYGVSRLWLTINANNKKASIFDYGADDIDELKTIIEPEVSKPGFWNSTNQDMKMGYTRYLEYLKKDYVQSMTAEERKELFRKYLADCGKCNVRDGKGPNIASLDEYWRALSREKRINTFEYEDDVIFEEIKNTSGIYNK